MTKIDDKQEGPEAAGCAKDHMHTEYSKNLFAAAHAASNEFTKKVTDICATNLALGKTFLSCTNFEEVINWGEQAIQTNLETGVQGVGAIYSKACSEVTKANGEMVKKISQDLAGLKNKFK